MAALGTAAIQDPPPDPEPQKEEKKEDQKYPEKCLEVTRLDFHGPSTRFPYSQWEPFLAIYPSA